MLVLLGILLFSKKVTAPSAICESQSEVKPCTDNCTCIDMYLDYKGSRSSCFLLHNSIIIIYVLTSPQKVLTNLLAGRGERRLCGGEAQCKDQGDLTWCKLDARRGETCGSRTIFNRCVLGIPGQCVHQKRQSDQSYDCLDRSDEDPFATRRTLPRDPSVLEECTDERGNRGLQCTMCTLYSFFSS